MKELTTLNNKFTESEMEKENNFSRSRNFDFTCIHVNIFECLKWFVILQMCSWNTEAEVTRWSVKMVFLTVLQNSQENVYVGVSY